ncbi:sensor histidine kinase [Microtetraspora niveoalba]|uniref:sensor histidine kinase n=1 Tax=Microtetraspora niveoalba TaxID=46175 RepID=UPI000A04C1EE|nr:ATP-binding protein [Microtetraspora niveoalba]
MVGGLRAAVAGEGGARAGPGAAERELNRAAERYAVWLRTAVIVPCAVFGFFAAPSGREPVAAALAGVAIGWCALHLVRPRSRSRRDTWSVAAVDGVVLVSIGLGQPVAGTPDSGSWVLAVVSITAVTFPYEWPTKPLVGGALAVLGLGAYVAGSVAYSGEWWPMLPPAVRVLTELTLSRLSYVLVRSQARRADRLTGRVAARRREAAVTAARRAGEREYLATLHDTASATLLMVAAGTGDGTRRVAERARQDLEELARVPGSDVSRVDLGRLLATATRRRAVLVRSEIGRLPPLPAGPALAVFHGVREALTNVERHAEAAEAALRAEVDERGRIVVELRDRGRGFDPDEVSPHRRGVSGSIIERMAAAGGRALVTSRPGRGTTVRWTWPDDRDG